MRELLLVRHGESEHLVRGISGGWTDLPLTALGRRQTTMYDAAPASITRLRVASDRSRTISFLNDTCHLRKCVV
jgi:broad specificity phosphatase PhoE